MIIVLKRWSWKGCFSVTLGKILHIYCSCLPGDRAHWVDMIGSLSRCSCKGCSSPTKRSLFKFIHISWVTDLEDTDTKEASVCSFSGLSGDRACSVNITGFSEKWPFKGHLSQWTREASEHLFMFPGRQSFKSVRLGKPPHIHCSGLLRHRAIWVNMIVLFGRCSCKGHSSQTQENLCTFVQVSQET